jgi:hypothetical protein
MSHTNLLSYHLMVMTYFIFSSEEYKDRKVIYRSYQDINWHDFIFYRCNVASFVTWTYISLHSLPITTCHRPPHASGHDPPHHFNHYCRQTTIYPIYHLRQCTLISSITNSPPGQRSNCSWKSLVLLNIFYWEQSEYYSLSCGRFTLAVVWLCICVCILKI